MNQNEGTNAVETPIPAGKMEGFLYLCSLSNPLRYQKTTVWTVWKTSEFRGTDSELDVDNFQLGYLVVHPRNHGVHPRNSTLPIPCYKFTLWFLTPNHHQISMFHGWIPWTITMKSPWHYHGLLVNSLPQSPPKPTTRTPWPSPPAGSALALLPPVVPRAGGSEVSLEARMVGWMVPWGPVGFVKARWTGFMVMKHDETTYKTTSWLMN